MHLMSFENTKLPIIHSKTIFSLSIQCTLLLTSTFSLNWTQFGFSYSFSDTTNSLCNCTLQFYSSLYCVWEFLHSNPLSTKWFEIGLFFSLHCSIQYSIGYDFPSTLGWRNDWFFRAATEKITRSWNVSQSICTI